VTWVKWKLALARFETVLILAQECTVCDGCTTGMEILLAKPDGPPRDVGQMEAHFVPFCDSVNLYTRVVHGWRRTCNRLQNRFGRTRWNY
jgi:hypothetical protein